MKSKYIRPMPAFYKDGAKIKLEGGGDGPRTPAQNHALIRPQAQSIIMKFGGARELARTLRECSDDPRDHFTPSAIYRWMYPREAGGRGGEIPLPALQTILRCARIAGVMLSPEDIYPNVVNGPNVQSP